MPWAQNNIHVAAHGHFSVDETEMEHIDWTMFRLMKWKAEEGYTAFQLNQTSTSFRYEWHVQSVKKANDADCHSMEPMNWYWINRRKTNEKIYAKNSADNPKSKGKWSEKKSSALFYFEIEGIRFSTLSHYSDNKVWTKKKATTTEKKENSADLIALVCNSNEFRKEPGQQWIPSHCQHAMQCDTQRANCISHSIRLQVQRKIIL